MTLVEKVRDYLAKKFILPLLESSFSTSQAQKAQNKINVWKLFARILILILFGLGGILVAIGSEKKNTDVTNIGIGILASGLVSIIFLAYEGYNTKITVIRARANFLDSLIRLIYSNIPILKIKDEPAKTYTFSDYIHMLHRQYHNFYKRHEIIDTEGVALCEFLKSHISRVDDQMSEIFTNYSFQSLQDVFSKSELNYILGFRNAFLRASTKVHSDRLIEAIFYFSVFLDEITHMVKYIEEMKVFDKIEATLDEEGQVVFDRKEFYKCEDNIKFFDDFMAIRSANYAKMRHEEKASVEKE